MPIKNSFILQYSSRMLLLCVLLSNPSLAIDSDGNYAIWGKGQKSCYNYQVARNTGPEEVQAFKHYLMGYLTSANVQMTDTYSISKQMNINEILDWLDDYCESKPTVSFVQALASFIVAHYDKRAKNSPSQYSR